MGRDIPLQVVAEFRSQFNSPPALTQTRDRSLYGTIEQGGIDGGGEVFRLTPEGEFIELFPFGYTNGWRVNGPLVETADGYLYGTTLLGGEFSAGTVFRMSAADGSIAVLHDLSMAEGAFPRCGLVEGDDGAFYGVTSDGGPKFEGFYSQGSLFRIDPGGTFTTLYVFQRLKWGFGPSQALALGEHGWLYGVTYTGGANGAGTVFKAKPSGALTSVYAFGTSDGWPANGLAVGADGDLYGTTIGGGQGGLGTAFKMTPQGKITNLVLFQGTNGSNPSAFVRADDGFVYCTALVSGGFGIILRVATDGAVEKCHEFNSAEGYPAGQLYRGRDGALYGVTGYGGQYGFGIIYKLIPPSLENWAEL